MMEGQPEAKDDKISFDIKEIEYLSLKEIIEIIPKCEDNHLKIDLNQLYSSSIKYLSAKVCSTTFSLHSLSTTVLPIGAADYNGSTN
ncbi:hypothetical protein LG311_21115 [Sutcliffiella horikoshii]|uniref:hypothetical protein n=1 Tax=Sutcliffiella horikoshii TaxID=79883 RepID=UPI00384E6B0F